MNFFRVVIELFALYLLYKLVFDFIIPVANTTKQVKKQFGDMHQKMNQFNEEQKKQNASATKATPSKEDYIDYEEVK